jgi:hypothetical protein
MQANHHHRLVVIKGVSMRTHESTQRALLD